MTFDALTGVKAREVQLNSGGPSLDPPTQQGELQMGIYFQLANVDDNYNRDLNVYPILDEKKAILTESFKKSGPWPNMTIHVDFEKPEIDALNLIAAQLTANPDMECPPEWERITFTDHTGVEVTVPVYQGSGIIPWGHHRKYTAIDMGIEIMEFALVNLTDEDMIVQMIAENHNDYSSNMLVQLESIRQFDAFLMKQVREAKDYDEYKELGYTNLSKAQYEAAKDNGFVGVKALTKLLGDSWSKTAVSYVAATLKAIDEGLVTLAQAASMPSITVMNAFVKLVTAIRAREQEWPQYFIDFFIDDVVRQITEEAYRPSLKTVENCVKAVKDGKNPIMYLSKGKADVFDVVAAMLSKVPEVPQEGGLLPMDYMEMDGFVGFNDLSKLVQKVQVAYEARQKKLEDSTSGDAENQEGEEGSSTDTPAADGETTAAVDEALEGGTEGGEADVLSMVKGNLAGNANVVATDLRTFNEQIDSVKERHLFGQVESEQLIAVIAQATCLLRSFFTVDEVNAAVDGAIMAFVEEADNADDPDSGDLA